MTAAWVHTLIPAAFAIFGTIVAVDLHPGQALVRAIQHCAAGVGFAASAVSRRDDVMNQFLDKRTQDAA